VRVVDRVTRRVFRVAYPVYAPYDSRMTNTTAPAFTHTATCDALTIGRLVQQLHAIALTEAPAPVADALSVLEYVISTANDGSPRGCSCGADALLKVNADLTLARKRERAYRNSPAFGSAEYSAVMNEVDALVARRAAIREALAR